MGDKTRHGKTHSYPEELFSCPAHHGEIGDKKNERSQSAWIQPLDQSGQEDGQESKGFKSFYNGCICLLNLRVFHFESGLRLNLFIRCDQGLDLRFGDLSGGKVIVADKNARGEQTFLYRKVETGRQGFV